jgi:hypothetical protein
MIRRSICTPADRRGGARGTITATPHPRRMAARRRTPRKKAEAWHTHPPALFASTRHATSGSGLRRVACASSASWRNPRVNMTMRLTAHSRARRMRFGTRTGRPRRCVRRCPVAAPASLMFDGNLAVPSGCEILAAHGRRPMCNPPYRPRRRSDVTISAIPAPVVGQQRAVTGLESWRQA